MHIKTYRGENTLDFSGTSEELAAAVQAGVIVGFPLVISHDPGTIHFSIPAEGESSPAETDLDIRTEDDLMAIQCEGILACRAGKNYCADDPYINDFAKSSAWSRGFKEEEVRDLRANADVDNLRDILRAGGSAFDAGKDYVFDDPYRGDLVKSSIWSRGFLEAQVKDLKAKLSLTSQDDTASIVPGVPDSTFHRMAQDALHSSPGFHNFLGDSLVHRTLSHSEVVKLFEAIPQRCMPRATNLRFLREAYFDGRDLHLTAGRAAELVRFFYHRVPIGDWYGSVWKSLRASLPNHPGLEGIPL